MERFAEPILHVDMDAFFVEVERRRDPSLAGRPVVVGGLGRRGVVAAASYEARAHGVVSAMPMAEARRRCPGAVFLPPDHARYRTASHEVFAVFDEFTPHVEPLSVDEAFLDVGGLRRLHPSSEAVGEAVRHRIRTRLGLPASVGIAAVKFVAKMASEDAKPDGLHRVVAGGEAAYLAPLPVRRLWGVGEATHASLETLGVHTIGDLAAVPARLLAATVGRSVAAGLAALAVGTDPRQVERSTPARSISVEETYDEDLMPSQAPEALAELCDRLSRRLRSAEPQGRDPTGSPRSGGTGVRAATVVLKVRFEDFTTLTRQHTAGDAMGGSGLWPVVRRLWEEVPATGRGIRLLGVGAAALTGVDAPRQMSLDAAPTGRTGDLVDEIRARFGDDAVVPGALVRPRREGSGEPG